MGLALALAAGPLRAQEPLDLELGDASKDLLKKVFDSPPPWAVESPGAAGATFELGLDTLFEHQESLDLASMHTTVTVLDSGGGGSVTEVLGDPALLNRKFDFLSELRGEGTQGSIALPTFGLPIYPTLHWQALSADLRLDFLNQPEPTESTSIEGRGLLYGVGFDLVTALCKHCGWFASTGYQVQDMPSFSADRKPRIAGLDLSRDEVRIRRRVRDASFRIGYGAPGARVIPYTGVRRRSTDLDIEDELGFRGPGPDGTSEETRLKTRIKIKGDATLAVAGLDVKFGGGLFGRMETAIGDGDRVVMVKLVYLWSQQDIDNRRLKKRAREIAAGILPRLIAIEKEYLAGWHALHVVAGDGGEPSYLVQEVDALLKGTKNALLDVMNDYPELGALGDWIEIEFERARKELGLDTGRTAGSSVTGALPARFNGSSPKYAFTSAILLAQRQDPTIGKKNADSTLSKVGEMPVGLPVRAAKIENGNGLLTEFGFSETNFGNVGVTIVKYLSSKPWEEPTPGKKTTPRKKFAPGEWRLVPIGTYAYGIYAYDVVKEGKLTSFRCDREGGGSNASCPLDLVAPKGCKVLRCENERCWQEDCSDQL